MYREDGTTIKDRREALRCRLKSLMEEARIIRKAEGRIWGPLREELHKKRTRYLRREARAAHLAYGIIRGLKISDMEAQPLSNPDWDKVRGLVKYYGSYDLGFFAQPTAVVVVNKPRKLKKRYEASIEPYTPLTLIPEPAPIAAWPFPTSNKPPATTLVGSRY